MGKICVHILVMHHLALIILLFISYYVNATVSPQYSVLLSAPYVEIRLYHESSVISAPAPVMGGTSFNKSTHDGFTRLYQYIHGANEDNTK
ncbi:Regulatory factor, effector, bacterial [Artemisia annua]|uniref:Regulatory factor, effector, bacterial n=1 Tax=Artemisia annua TaxID=35608 RepID=A0A2U1Q8S5_ARTAN|nr:Regulatory factor, effector, bacterial [Artemisia annua]